MVIVYLQTVRRVKGSDRGEALQEMIVFMKKDRRAVYDSLRKKAEDLLKIKFLNSDSDQLVNLEVSDFVKLFHELDSYKIELELMNEEILHAKGLAEDREKHFREIVESQAEGIGLVNQNEIFEFVNRAAEKIFEVGQTELIGSSLFDFVSPDDIVKIKQQSEGRMKGIASVYELPITTKKGNKKYLSVSATPKVDENDNYIGAYAVFSDITRQVMDEKAILDLNAKLEDKVRERTAQLVETNKILLKEVEERSFIEKEIVFERQRLSEIIKGTNVGTWEWNIRTGETIFNERWADIIGYTLDEISPSSIEIWTKFTHPDDLKLSAELLDKHFKGNSDFYSCEARMKHKNGDWVWVFDRGRVSEWDEAGKPIYMSGTHHDITDQKLSEIFSREVLKLSVQLTGIPISEIPDALNVALQRIGEFLGADRAYIFEINPSENTMSNTYEWCKKGISPEIGNLQNLPVDVLPMWYDKIQKNENIIIPSVQDLPDTWEYERETLVMQGIQSLIAIPVLLENKPIGFVGLDSVANKRQYKETEINILMVWSNLLGSLINHQRKEAAIEQTRINYETFFNTIDDYLFVLDAQGNTIHVNTSVTKRLGYTTGEIYGRSVLMFHPEERREEAGRTVGEMLAGTADFCPVPLITKTGEYVPVETRVKPGFWDGKPVIFGVSKDVSKIKLSEEKFSKAFQSNSALMAISDCNNGVFLDVNDTFLNSLGYAREEVIGKTALELGLYMDVDVRTDIMEKMKQKIPVREIELGVKTKSGLTITGLFSADLIFVGEKRCMLTVMVDITGRKQAEEETRIARNEAEKANLAKSEFLSRMSHELRTPMNSILGFAQLLNMGNLHPSQKKSINHILSSGKHLLNLINEVLDISRIEANKLSLSLEPVRVNLVISEMIDIVQQHANERKLTIRFPNSPGCDLFVKSDSQRLKQILLNLLNNAIKYNRLGGSVTIKTEAQPPDKNNKAFVRISVTDSGIGIATEDLPKLFKPFERIGAEKTETEGTGLGLTVVKKLTDAMEGKIGVESTFGVGSAFWIELPLVVQEESAAEKVTEVFSNASESSKNAGTILYIEDNISNAELVDGVLENYRPAITLVTTIYGRNAIDLAITHKPRLILLDLDLPDIHGSKVLSNLLDNDQTKDIPVIIISADATLQQITRLIKAGAKDYMTKPLDIMAFLRVVDEWMDEEKGKKI